MARTHKRFVITSFVVFGLALVALVALAFRPTDTARDEQLRQNAATPPESAVRVDWWPVNNQVIEEALQRDIGKWACELEAKPLPEDVTELLLRFNVLIRAGHEQSVRPVIEQLAVSDGLLRWTLLNEMSDFLIHHEHWDLALYLLQRFTRVPLSSANQVIEYWAKETDAEEIDRWLAQREELNPDAWFLTRIDFRRKRGTVNKLIDELEKQVRAKPKELDPTLRYLRAIGHVGVQHYDVRWLSEVCRPKTAYEKFQLAGELSNLLPRFAIALLEQSLETSFTQKDQQAMVERMRDRSLVIEPDPPSWEETFRDWTKQSLMLLYKEESEPQKAQKLLDELTAKYPDGTPPELAQTAGQIQAQSGARVIEGRIRQAESENKDSAAYWLQRAEYFVGRKEPDEAINAFEAALTLATGIDEKVRVVMHYKHFLGKTDRHEAGAKMLWNEFEDAERGGVYAVQIIRELIAFEGWSDKILLRPDDERLWNHLAAAQLWYHEEELLERMVKNVAQSTYSRQRIWQQAEDLANLPDADPTRAKAIASVMIKFDEHARAQPLLEQAVSRLKGDLDRKDVARKLGEAYLRTSNWKSAEQLVEQQFTPSERIGWYSRLACFAAMAGDTDDAMRLWKMHANLDVASTWNVSRMVEAGMRDQLLAFYGQVKVDDPASTAPDRVIRFINSVAKK